MNGVVIVSQGMVIVLGFLSRSRLQCPWNCFTQRRGCFWTGRPDRFLPVLGGKRVLVLEKPFERLRLGLDSLCKRGGFRSMP